jgi:hypothetical protein
VPSFDGAEPLAPDARVHDHTVPCWYWHTKLAALNGGWVKLTAEERAFVAWK